MLNPENFFGAARMFYNDTLRSGVEDSPSFSAAFLGGALATCLTYGVDGTPNFKKKVDAGGCLVFPNYDVLGLMSPGASRFVERAIEMGYAPEVWFHRPSRGKTDIGYELDEVTITLAYATTRDSTTYLIFTRDREDRKVPRRVIKRLVGTKDLEAAMKLAEENVSCMMGRGHMGPFNLSGNLVGEGDRVYVHDASYKQSEQEPEHLVNFSAGPDVVSFNMRLVDAANVMRESGALVEVCDLFGSDV